MNKKIEKLVKELLSVGIGNEYKKLLEKVLEIAYLEGKKDEAEIILKNMR